MDKGLFMQYGRKPMFLLDLQVPLLGVTGNHPHDACYSWVVRTVGRKGGRKPHLNIWCQRLFQKSSGDELHQGATKTGGQSAGIWCMGEEQANEHGDGCEVLSSQQCV